MENIEKELIMLFKAHERRILSKRIQEGIRLSKGKKKYEKE